MLFLEPERTQYDLQWRMFGTYVRVHPFFWLISAILGWNIAEHDGLTYLAVWIACVFGSILLHEFGHVWMGQWFGSHGHIILYGMGGLAVGSNALASPWKRVAVLFAGPLIQLLLFAGIFGVIWWLGRQGIRVKDLDVPTQLGFAALGYLWFINLYWPLLNLLPIWPLDGGQISREFLTWLVPHNGVRVALGISFVVAGLLAINSLVARFNQGQPLIPYVPAGGMWMAILFGLLALGSYQALQSERDNEPPWKRWDSR